MSILPGILGGGLPGVYRTFLTGEYDLNCPVVADSPVLPSLVSDYALWSLFSDRADSLGNFDNLTLHGDDEDVAYPFHSFYFDGWHWLNTPSGAAGMDLEGILKDGDEYNSSSSSYSFSIHFLIDSLPSPGTYRWILFSGCLDSHIGVRVLSDGRLEYVRVCGSDISSVFSSPCPLNSWCYLFLLHDGTNLSSCKMIVNDVSYPLPSLFPITAKDPSLGESTPISLGKGIAYDFVPFPSTWDSNTAHPKFSFSPDFLHLSSDSNYSYGSCGSTGVIGSEGKYYWELVFSSGTYLWFGLADNGADFTKSAPLIGWVVACHNGRIWNHATGGGSNWKGSIPLSSRIGVAYDAGAGKLSVFVNGVFFGTLPYTISGEVVPVVCSDGESSISLFESPDSWEYQPPDDSYSSLPHTEKLVSSGDAPLYRGRMRLFRARKGYPPEQEYLGDSSLRSLDILPRFYCVDSAGVEHALDGFVYKWYEANGYVGIKTPNLPRGFYRIYSRYLHSGVSVVKEVKRVNIANDKNLFTGNSLVSTFEIGNLDPLGIWDVCHKAWGGDNGGCSSRLVSVSSHASLKAYGDSYDGVDSFGVDRLGNPTNRKTRVGSCLITRHYFPPGRFDFLVTYPSLPGACSAIWGFHYEEAYPGDNLWRELLNDNLHRAGNSELGHWIVRNHEIDIETPTSLKTDPNHEDAVYLNGRFNSWRGELRNWDVDESDPAYWSEYTDMWLPFPNGDISQNGPHKLSVIWKTDPESVEFLVDDVHVTTITEHIPTIPMKWWVGIWFPSASTKWAGASADWASQELLLHRFEYSKIPGQPVYLAPESYPSIGVRKLTPSHFSLY